jgi:hypothetical protein
MASVLIPRPNNQAGSSIGGILPAIGSAFGPIGGAIGGAAGSVIGGSAKYQDKQNEQITAAADSSAPKDIATPSAGDAMERRADKLEEDPYEAVKKARMAIEQAPQDLQDAYKEQLDEAMRVANQQRNIA